MKKAICILISALTVFSCVSVPVFAADTVGTDSGKFEFEAGIDKTEFSAGETVDIGISLINRTGYRIGEVVTWIEYDGNVCLAPSVPEVDMPGCIINGGSFNPSFLLEGKENSVFMRTFYRILMFITRNFVIFRQKMNNLDDLGNILALIPHKSRLGTVGITYDGKEVELSFFISYVNIRKDMNSDSDIVFEPISSQELAVNDSDKQLCRDWFYENVVNAGQNGKAPAYNFSLGGRSLRENLPEWSFETVAEDEDYDKYRGGRYSEIRLINEKRGIAGRVEAVLYENSATCEWTVYLADVSRKNSGRIKDFNAVEFSFPTGSAALYSSLGSSSSPNDFTLSRATEKRRYNFDCREGRSSDYYLPYFNICGEEFGFCLGIGWSGQWNASIELSEDSVSVAAKQETLNASLVPGEEIRSPLVSLSFYDNANPVKGFNIFRSWVRNSLLSEKLPDTMLNVDAFFVSPTRTAEEMLRDLGMIPEERYEEIDNLWIDAGWYCSGSDSIWNDRFGVWETTENRFPRGMKEISDFASARDTGVVLWYEEERLSNVADSALYSEGKKHEGWILGKDGGKFTTGLVWNFGDPDALDYICRFMDSSLKSNGVTVLREDSNFDPLSYWKYGDRHIYGGRDGICENHYVDGHYRFIDYLFENNDKLQAYDCCASGGRRLDLEVIRRGVPLWRSDYNCEQHGNIIEATQSQSYSVSFWLPYTGTYYYTGNDYRSRTTLYQGVQVFCGDMAADEAYKEIVKYKPEREMMNGNFFPITYGGTAKDRITSMQYGSDDKGFAVIYKRIDVTDTEFGFRFSGLDSDAMYEVYNYDDNGNVMRISGAELMTEAYSVPLSDGEQALIIEYRKTV